MTSLRTAIETLLADPEDVTLARSILRSDDAAVIAGRLEAFTREHLGREIVACPLFIQSVGAVFGLDLDDGSRVVIKAHQLGGARQGGLAAMADLEAVYEVQAELHAAGFACARVIVGPRAFGEGAAAVMSYLETEPVTDHTAPEVRRAMATELARLVELGPRLQARDRLPKRTLPATLLPAPHNALFDFTQPGGEWIDDRAREARAILDGADRPDAIMHCDVAGSNVVVNGGRVVAVFDMDSVARINELFCLGSIAVHWTYPARWPTRDEARAFVADYLNARGRVLTAPEQRTLDAAAIYAMAYTARCEHRPGAVGTMMTALRSAPGAYLSA